MLCRLATAYAGLADSFLDEGDTTGLNSARFVLELVLTLGLATPHSLDKAGMILCDVKEFLIAMSNAGLFLKVLKCSLIKLVVYCRKSLLHLFNKIVKRNKGLLTADTANENAGVVLNITGADLKTERYSLHFVLAILPAR